MAEEQLKPKKQAPSAELPNKRKLSLIGFGTYKLQDQDHLVKLLRKGLEIGYCHHIDTARYYNNQIPLGQAIKTVISEDRCKREDLFIATKSFNHIHSDPVLELKEALRLMQLDYVDLYYLHWPYVDQNQKGDQWLHRSLEDCWARFEECVRKGYTKYLGISNFNGQLMNDLLAFCKIKPIVIQNEFHPYQWNQPLIDSAHRQGLIVLAHTPLGRGDRQDELSVVKDEVIQDIATKHGRTAAQVTLKSSLHRGVGVIPKTGNPGRLQQNWESWTVQLTEDDMKKIRNNISKRLRICDGKKMFLSFDNFDF